MDSSCQASTQNFLVFFYFRQQRASIHHLQAPSSAFHLLSSYLLVSPGDSKCFSLQWFSNFSVHSHHLEDSLEHRMLSTAWGFCFSTPPRVSASVDLGGVENLHYYRYLIPRGGWYCRSREDHRTRCALFYQQLCILHLLKSQTQYKEGLHTFWNQR